MSTGELLRVCTGQITIDDIVKAAKCAKLDSVRAYKSSTGSAGVMLETFDFPIKKNVYITRAMKPAKKSTRTQVFNVCESTSVLPVRTSSPTRNVGSVSNEFKIVQSSNGSVLRICVGRITKDDLDRAAKCAGYKKYRVYKYKHMVKCEITVDNLPVSMDVYISKAAEKQKNKTKIFSVCESTSILPTRTPVSTPAPVSSGNAVKKGLLDKAIKCFKDGIAALESLSRNL